MIDTSALLHRPVLSRSCCRIIGSVTDVYYDENCKKIAYLALAQATDDTCRNFDGAALLPFKEICNISDAIVIADDVELLALPDVDTTSMVHGLDAKSVFSATGMLKGRVDNVKCTDGGKVVKICTSDSEYAPSAISGFGDVLLLKGAGTVQKKRRIPRPAQDNPVEMLNLQNDLQSEDNLKADNVSARGPKIKNSSVPDAAQDAGTEYDDNAACDDKNASSNENGEAAAYAVDESEFEKTVFSFKQNTVTALPETTPNRQPDASVENPFDTVQSFITAQEPSQTPGAFTFGDEREPVFTKEAFEKISGISVTQAASDDVHMPTRIICEYDFLLGRTLVCDLKSYIGEILATKGAIVNDEVVEKARRCGKLVELTLNSK